MTRETVVRVTDLTGGRPLTSGETAALSCAACAWPLYVVHEYASAACLNPGCPLRARPLLLPDIATEYAALHGDPNPPGWPRPVVDGRPVPWITPVIGGVVFWKAVHGERVTHAQEAWACQVCGLPLPERAWAHVDRVGRMPTAALSHERCARLASAVCPALIEHGTACVLVDRADVTGVPYVDGEECEGLRAPITTLTAPTADWNVPAHLLYTAGCPYS